MPRLSLGLGVQNILKIGEAPITTSKAFNSSGVQVGSTITGDIPNSWVKNEATVASVIFANNNSVTAIGSQAFYYCTSLSTITIPNSVTAIGSQAFYGCTSLATATIGNSVQSIGNYAFAKNQLTELTIPASVTSIGNYAFNNNDLTAVTIPNNVTSLGLYAFGNNPLVSVNINMTNIPASAFPGLGLTAVTIGNSVTTIGGNSFANNSLTTLTIPNSVTSVGSYAFSYNLGLTSVSCFAAQTAFVGSNAFDQTASPLTIRARAVDATWTAGTGLTFQGNTNVTVIKNL
jgi:hypothetical protein